jgi:glycosyltransferase involved in cell wall biosynthesis
MGVHFFHLSASPWKHDGTMDKPKVLFVGHSAHLNGAEYSLLRLIDEIKDRIDPIVLAPKGGPFEKLILERQLPFFDLQPHHPFVLKKDRKSVLVAFFCGLMNQRDALLQKLPAFDLVHSNTLYVWEGALLAAARNKPHLWNPREIPETSPTWNNALGWTQTYTHMEQLCDHMVCVSHALFKHLPPSLQNKSSVTHNGLNPKEILSVDHAKQWLQNEHGIPKEHKVALCVGNFIPEKGHQRLIEIYMDKFSAFKDWHLLLVGEKHFTYPKIQSMLETEPQRSKNIHCIGPISNMGEKFSCADLYLCASHTEAFPTVLLEARMAQVPFITTNCGGSFEIAKMGGGICLDTWKEFEQTMEQAISEPQAWSVPEQQEGFTMKQMGDGYLKAYGELLKKTLTPAIHEERKQCIENWEHLAQDLKHGLRDSQILDRLCSLRGLGRIFRMWRTS